MTKDRRFYISVEVDFFDNRKTLEVGERLAFRYLKAIAWSHKNRTDGLVSRAAAKELLYSAKSADQLVAAGLWEVVEGGWMIHDYTTHQESRASLEAAADAGRKGAAIRWGNGVPIGDRITTQRQSQTHTQSTNEEDGPLAVLASGTWWPYDEHKDRALLDGLIAEYPTVRALKVVRDLKTWSMDNDLGGRPRMRLRNFFRKAEEFAARDKRDVVRPLPSVDDQLAALRGAR